MFKGREVKAACWVGNKTCFGGRQWGGLSVERQPGANCEGSSRSSFKIAVVGIGATNVCKCGLDVRLPFGWIVLLIM